MPTTKPIFRSHRRKFFKSGKVTRCENCVKFVVQYVPRIKPPKWGKKSRWSSCCEKLGAMNFPNHGSCGGLRAAKNSFVHSLIKTSKGTTSRCVKSSGYSYGIVGVYIVTATCDVVR